MTKNQVPDAVGLQENRPPSSLKSGRVGDRVASVALETQLVFPVEPRLHRFELIKIQNLKRFP